MTNTFPATKTQRHEVSQRKFNLNLKDNLVYLRDLEYFPIYRDMLWL